MISCTICGYDKNPDGLEFCDACGAELETIVSVDVEAQEIETNTPTPEQMEMEDTFVPPVSEPASFVPQTSSTTARLIAKQPQAPIPEFPIEGNALIGIFDPDMGPVDIDLEDFSGNETVSRHHAEIYQETGIWKIKDLGSTNGVFIKPMGQTRFGARITTPESLNPGDEIAIAKIRFLFQSP